MLESHLKFLSIVTHLIYRILILTLLETIVWNKILFKFEDNKETNFVLKKTNKLCLKKQTLIFQIDNIN